MMYTSHVGIAVYAHLILSKAWTESVGWDEQRESQHCVSPVAGITLRSIPAYNLINTIKLNSSA